MSLCAGIEGVCVVACTGIEGVCVIVCWHRGSVWHCVLA